MPRRGTKRHEKRGMAVGVWRAVGCLGEVTAEVGVVDGGVGLGRVILADCVGTACRAASACRTEANSHSSIWHSGHALLMHFGTDMPQSGCRHFDYTFRSQIPNGAVCRLTCELKSSLDPYLGLFRTCREPRASSAIGARTPRWLGSAKCREYGREVEGGVVRTLRKSIAQEGWENRSILGGVAGQVVEAWGTRGGFPCRRSSVC